MSIQNFIPTIWSARIQDALMKSLVYAAPGVVNRDYEGDIRDVGDSVRINMIGDPTVKTYVKNADLDAPEQLQDASTMLAIDQGDYFHFYVDDVDRRQAMPGFFDKAMQRAAYKQRDAADIFVAGQLYAGVPAANMVGTVGSPKTITSANESYTYLVDLGVELDEANVPSEGRWCIVPPWYHGLLLKRQEFVLQSTQQSEERLANGVVGQAAGFMITVSNNVPATGSDFRVLAGVDMAGTFADQIMKLEAYRPEKQFSDAVKGLHIYGFKTIRPECVACLHVTRP